MADEQCAVGPDGQLLPADQITFYNDVDDSEPLLPSKPVAHSASVRGRPRTIADHFYAPCRTSSCTRNASVRAVDPNNVAGKSGKRKASGNVPCAASKSSCSSLHAPSASSCAASRLSRASSPDPTDQDTNMPDLVDASNIEDGEGDEGDKEEAEFQAAYEDAKAASDADRLAKKIPKSDLTKDTKLIFTEGTITGPAGNKIKGSWCRICCKSPSTDKDTFLRGNVSLQRKHITRYPDTHFSVYKRLCEKNNVPMHHRAFPKDYNVEASGEKQTTLDAFAAPIPAFTKEGLTDHIIEFVAIRVVNEQPFRQIIKFCRPHLADKDIPHRTKITNEIYKKWDAVIEHIKSTLLVSMTFDTWTSAASDPYLGITAHYIDAPDDQPSKWELKCDQIVFVKIDRDHSGANLAQIIVKTLDEYDLRNKVGWFTADNTTNNDTALRAVADVVADLNMIQAQVSWSNPHLSSDKVNEFIKAALSEENNDGEVDVGATSGAMGKALALVKQIRASPQALEFLKKMCMESEIKPLQPLGYIRTRWASMHTFLERLIYLKAALNCFVSLADDTSEVPNLSGKCQYADFRLHVDDWKKLDAIQEVLQVR
ncbi:unnamed protein product [Mycena citricolor]|uniref:Uncharacterized protein n=1 Tax=Mycena citricolor TaxID=2018698 RepID=A0AAD2HJT0_9AGAR|nr:unnamed protein product [Mycena citricolor]